MRINKIIPSILALLIPLAAGAQAERNLSFTQSANYCNADVAWLQGQVTVYNPSNETVFAEFTGYLNYSTISGRTTASNYTTSYIAPGGTGLFSVYNGAYGYGCFSAMWTYGKLRVTSATEKGTSAIVASGNLTTTTLIANTSTTQSQNVPFTVK